MSKRGRPIVLEMRKRLVTLCNLRERAYREALRGGTIVPKLKLKTEAIHLIRIQLAASEQWSLESHIRMVNGMADHIELLTPDIESRFHNVRKGIVDLLTWCFNQTHPKQLDHAA